MATSILALQVVFLFTTFLTSGAVHDNIFQCLASHPSLPYHTLNSSSYSSLLVSSVRNFRLSSSFIRKPDLILTPLDESQVQTAVLCCRKHGLLMKIRSGGHDFEGLSYVSDVPFVILDLVKMASINVDAKRGTAWVQTGATLGQLYYRIAEKSRRYGFPGGVCPTVGIGGLVSGGGYGYLLRKYGLAADNILDAWIVNADGEIHDRKTMGEDLFWAIRGGGASSFAVVLSWKIRLVPVPLTMTAFRLFRTLEQGATSLVEKWQHVAPKLPREIFSQVFIHVANSSHAQEGRQKTVEATFQSEFQGKAEELVAIMDKHFPELGVKKEDCVEMSWIQLALWIVGYPIDDPIGYPLEILLDRSLTPMETFKAKVDYVTEPISQEGWKGIWEYVLEEERPRFILTAYGGKMSEIPESSIPFPHRKGNIFKFLQVVYWENNGVKESRKHIDWIRRLNNYLVPYVSKSPKASYVNYNDLDFGRSKNGTTTYSEAKAWGSKYFKNNFDKLVEVKTKVDPHNFFRNEQSIPVRITSVGKTHSHGSFSE